MFQGRVSGGNRNIAAVLVILAVAAACADDEGPGSFTTAGTCYAGDVETCTCTTAGHVGAAGVHTCGADGRFASECRCAGCTVSPDCSQCPKECLEQCLCETSGQQTDCTARCAQDAGKTTASYEPPQGRAE